MPWLIFNTTSSQHMTEAQLSLIILVNHIELRALGRNIVCLDHAEHANQIAVILLSTERKTRPGRMWRMVVT